MCECSFCFPLFLLVCLVGFVFVSVSVFCSSPPSPLEATDGRGHGGYCRRTCSSSSCNQLAYLYSDQPSRPVESLNQLQWETPATSNHLWNFSVLLILFSQSRLRLPALSLNPVCPPASPTSSLEPERNHQPDATRTPAAQTSTWSVQIFHKFLYLTSTLVCVSVRGPQTWQ